MFICFKKIKTLVLSSLLIICILYSSNINSAVNSDNIPDGYDPAMSDPEEKLSVEERVQRQISEFLETVRNTIPENNEAYRDFYRKVFLFQKKYAEYLKRYYQAIDIMEPMVFETDNLALQDKILKEQLGYNSKDLSKELNELNVILEYDIEQDIKTYYRELTLEEIKNGPKDYEERYEGKPLTEVVQEAVKELKEYKKVWDKYAEKMVEAKGKISNKSRKFVSLANTNSELDLELKGIKGFPQMIIFEEIQSYVLQDREEKISRIRSQGIDASVMFVEALANIENDPTLKNKDKIRKIRTAKAYIYGLLEKEQRDADNVNKMISKSAMVKAHLGSAINMYFAIIIKDAFNIATQGRFLTEEQRSIYVEKRGEKEVFKYTFREFWYDTFKRYLDPSKEEFWQTHIPFASFVIGAEAVRAIPAPKLVKGLYSYCNKGMYGFGGNMLRGVVGYTLSMGIGAKLSETVGSVMIFWDELGSENQEIRILASRIASKTVVDPKAWAGTAKFVVAFGMMDLALSLPLKAGQFYLKMKKLNKQKCKWLYEDIQNYSFNKLNSPKPWYQNGAVRYTTSIFRNSVVFIGAQFIENYLLDSWFMKGTIDAYNKEVEALYAALFDAELQMLTDSLLDTKMTGEKVEVVFDKLGGYLFLKNLVNGLRYDYRSELDKCLDLSKVEKGGTFTDEHGVVRDFYNIEDKDARACLESLYIKVMKPSSYEIYRYTDPKKYNDEILKDNSTEKKVQVEEQLLMESMNVLQDPKADETSKLMAMKMVTDTAYSGDMAEAAIVQQQYYALDNYVSLAEDEIKKGKMSLGEGLLSTYFTQYAKFNDIKEKYPNDEYLYISKVLNEDIASIINTPCGKDLGACWSEKQKRLFKEIYPVFLTSEAGAGLNSLVESKTPIFIDIRKRVLWAVSSYVFTNITKASGGKAPEQDQNLIDLYQLAGMMNGSKNYPSLVKNTIWDAFPYAGLPMYINY